MLGDYYEGYDRSLDTHISNLRKLGDDPIKPNYIKTVYGMGYKMEANMKRFGISYRITASLYNCSLTAGLSIFLLRPHETSFTNYVTQSQLKQGQELSLYWEMFMTKVVGMECNYYFRAGHDETKTE